MIGALVLALGMVLLPQPKPNPGQRSDEQQSISQTDKSTQTANRNLESDLRATHEDIGEKRLYHKYLRATIIAVVLSFFILLGFAWQTFQTIKAVQAAEKSAEALVASERAWIMVDVGKVPGQGGPLEGARLVGGILTHSTSIAIRITCENQGRTPAWITEIHACLDIVDNLPAIPDFTHADPVKLEPEPLAAKQKFSPNDITLQRDKGRDAGLMTVVYGIVKYRDVFSMDERTTAFGYGVGIDGAFVRLASSAYNRNT